MPEKQLKHIASRAEKTFPRLRIILLDLTEGSAGIGSGNHGSGRLTSFNRFSDFLASARVTSDGRAQIATAAAPAELLAAQE